MLELETARLAARIEELEREKVTLAAFAAVAAHELVEPLIITEAFAAMVSDRLDEEIHAESREDLAIAGRTATRTRHLLEALLQDARSGEHSLTRRPVDLAAVVDDSLAMLAHEVQARGATVRLGELPTVLGDASLLNGLFTNLILNALKYSPRTGSEIVVDASRERRRGGSRSRARARRSRRRTGSGSSSRSSAVAASAGRGAPASAHDLPPDRRAARRPDRRRARRPRRQPLLLHVARLRPHRAAVAAARLVCERDGLGARLGAELAHQVLDVRADGLVRQHERLGDLVGRLALIQEVDDLPFARRQRAPHRACRRRLRGAPELLDQLHREPARDRGLAPEGAFSACGSTSTSTSFDR